MGNMTQILEKYSIFSEVGMLPVYLMDLKPDNFKKVFQIL